jgi:hypothetical protein
MHSGQPAFIGIASCTLHHTLDPAAVAEAPGEASTTASSLQEG